jgi:hypothetical protein
MPAKTVEQVLKFTSEIDPRAVTAAFAELVALNDGRLEKMRAAERQFQGDIQGYASEGARNVAKYMRDSVNDQIEDLQRARKEVIAYSA